MSIAIRRSQVYGFLADAFLYPTEDWTRDLPLLADILGELHAADFGVGGLRAALEAGHWDLPGLQAEHRRTFGLVGSLCYETEIGLPHEFRQSQELADIAGFYRAFGFQVGGQVRERPDHLAVELEFMHVLALKEAYAFQIGLAEHVEIGRDAQGKFLTEHLGQWIGALAEALARSAGGGPYCELARCAAAFVLADAERLGAKPEVRQLDRARPTPLGPEMACDGCAVAERL
jgi:DMSO reductase family type II enzyme chaperone